MNLQQTFTSKSFRKVLAGSVLSTALFFQPLATLPVSAQTVSVVDTSAPLLATDSVKSNKSASPQPASSPENSALSTLREKYKTDLSIYRTDERDFTLARDQFGKLQTLAALEVAVKATRKVMITRALVLEDYLQILSLITADTSGIDVTEKSNLLKELETTTQQLKTHQKLAEQAIDRGSVQRAAVDFVPLNKQVVNVSYKSMSYINYGRLQTVYDKMLSVRDEVMAQISSQESNGLKLGEKRRALDEVNRNLDATKVSLEVVHKNFIPSSYDREVKFGPDSYSQTIQLLSRIYADESRNLSFLREVIK